jgi:hypothetical protein
MPPYSGQLPEPIIIQQVTEAGGQAYRMRAAYRMRSSLPYAGLPSVCGVAYRMQAALPYAGRPTVCGSPLQ